MSRTTTLATRTVSVRVDFLRNASDKKWRWAARSNGHVLADGGEGYSRRIDCLHAAMRVLGVRTLTWHGSHDGSYDYGQGVRGESVVECFVWHPQRWHR